MIGSPKTGRWGWLGRIVPVVVRRLMRCFTLCGVGLRRKVPVDALEAAKPWAVDPEFQKNTSGVAHSLTRDKDQISHYACESSPFDLEFDWQSFRVTQRLLADCTQNVEANPSEQENR